MPRWEVHLSFGMMALIVLVSALLLGRGNQGDPVGYIRSLLLFWIVILLGGGSMVFGSVLPDLDGRGRIRWIIGPAVGSLLFIPPLIGSWNSGGPREAVEFIGGAGSLLFLGGTAAGYLSLLIPKKHRGILHSSWTGVTYGTIWGAYVFQTASIALDLSLIIGSMGAVGYGWHLALDGRLL